jgi:hypothetical protein
MNFYVVTYKGAFGFIKPWTAVRDEETFSQQFLTPATVRGIEQRLFPELLEIYRPKIVRYRLRYKAINTQTERTQPKAFSTEIIDKVKFSIRKRSILKRGVLIEPELLVAFETREDAYHASQNHICLCRNEDVLLPDQAIVEVDSAQFITTEIGFELIQSQASDGFLVGYNRFEKSEPMYGKLIVVGNPLATESIF